MAIRQYKGEPYNSFPWGSAGYIDGYACPGDADPLDPPKINLTYLTNHTVETLVYLRYGIYNRYTGNEATIEDIYSNVTRRALALGCLDGPLFPFYSE